MFRKKETKQKYDDKEVLVDEQRDGRISRKKRQQPDESTLTAAVMSGVPRTPSSQGQRQGQ